MEISREVLDKRGIYWENRIKVFLQEEVPENPIVFIGDSLTERFPLEKYFGKGFVNRGLAETMPMDCGKEKSFVLGQKPKSVVFYDRYQRSFIQLQEG